MSERLPCAHFTPRLCNVDVKSYTLPSLPKVHTKATLVTTKLCEQIFKSHRAGLSFDLTSPKEALSPGHLYKYNSLHDPNLRLYFSQPTILSKLVKNGFITNSYDVVYSLKDYNLYRRFLENEYLKGHTELLDEKVNSMRSPKPASGGSRLNNAKMHERGKRRKEFFWQQEKKENLIQHKHKKILEEEAYIREQNAKREQINKEKAEVKRNQEKEKQCLRKLENHYKESVKKDLQRASKLIEEEARLMRLDKRKQEQRNATIKKLETKRKMYDENAELASLEAKAKKKEEEKEKSKKIQERSAAVKILQDRLEEKKKKFMEINHQRILALKKEADEFERQIKLARDYQIIQVRAKLKKEHLYWTKYLDSYVASHGLVNNRRPSSSRRSTRTISQKVLVTPRPTPTRLLTHRRVYTPLVLYTNRHTPELLDEGSKSKDISSMTSTVVVLKTSLPPSRETRPRSNAEGSELHEPLSELPEENEEVEENEVQKEDTQESNFGEGNDPDLKLDLAKLGMCDDTDDINNTNDTNDGDISDAKDNMDASDDAKDMDISDDAKDSTDISDDAKDIMDISDDVKDVMDISDDAKDTMNISNDMNEDEATEDGSIIGEDSSRKVHFSIPRHENDC